MILTFPVGLCVALDVVNEVMKLMMTFVIRLLHPPVGCVESSLMCCISFSLLEELREGGREEAHSFICTS